MKTLSKAALIAVLASTLSGCFLTKVVTTPMRIVGAAGSVVGAAVSVVPTVGNTADDALETVDKTIDETADKIDDVPI
jgi:ABC-type molybdate transport system permease subunit